MKLDSACREGTWIQHLLTLTSLAFIAGRTLHSHRNEGKIWHEFKLKCLIFSDPPFLPPQMPLSTEEQVVLKDIATKLRIHSVESTSEAKSGHPTSCSSMAEVMSALFFNVMR